MGVNSYYSIEGFGDKLRENRNTKGMTQKELARAIGVDEIQIRRYENGERYPKMEHLVAIIVTLEISLLDFIDVDENVAQKILEMERERLLYLSIDPQLLAQTFLDVIYHFRDENEWLRKQLAEK